MGVVAHIEQTGLPQCGGSGGEKRLRRLVIGCDQRADLRVAHAIAGEDEATFRDEGGLRQPLEKIAQQRDARGWNLRASASLMRMHLALGVLLGALALAIDARMAAWLAPVLLGLLLAPWLVTWTSRQAGPALTAMLRTPFEALPPSILVAPHESTPTFRVTAPVLESA